MIDEATTSRLRNGAPSLCRQFSQSIACPGQPQLIELNKHAGDKGVAGPDGIDHLDRPPDNIDLTICREHGCALATSGHDDDCRTSLNNLRGAGHRIPARPNPGKVLIGAPVDVGPSGPTRPPDVDAAMADPPLRQFVRHFLTVEAQPMVPAVSGIDLDRYVDGLIERFSNPQIGDQISRLCLDGSAKFPKFLLPTVRAQLAIDGPVGASALALAGWCRYLLGLTESGNQLVRSADPGLDAATAYALLLAQTLATHDHLDLIVIGGKVRKNTMAMVDGQAVEAVRPLTVDTLFISTDAASAITGLTTPYREEATLKRAMISAARRVVALIDYSKFDRDQFVRLAEWSDIDVLITNHELDPTIVAAVETTGTTVVLT